MSLFDYQQSRSMANAPFYALIMAACRAADSNNIELLREAWPETVRETQARYNAPGGCLTADEFRNMFGHDPDESTLASIRSFGYDERVAS